jgi:hypothetical protein
MRVDTTVVETNIHYPTDSSLLGDGVRVLKRLMKKVTEIAGETGSSFRDRRRSVQRRLIEIGRATRAKGVGAMERANPTSAVKTVTPVFSARVWASFHYLGDVSSAIGNLRVNRCNRIC